MRSGATAILIAAAAVLGACATAPPPAPPPQPLEEVAPPPPPPPSPTVISIAAVGGIRASIYNAFPEAGVDALIAFMKDFQAAHG